MRLSTEQKRAAIAATAHWFRGPAKLVRIADTWSVVGHPADEGRAFQERRCAWLGRLVATVVPATIERQDENWRHGSLHREQSGKWAVWFCANIYRPTRREVVAALLAEAAR